MKMSASVRKSRSVGAAWRARKSSMERTEVVPTAIRRPAGLNSACWVAAGISYTSRWMGCSSTRAVAMGRKVPRPTCRVRSANFTPAAEICASSSGVKCRPAVGAALASDGAVGVVVVTGDVGRQRHLADAVGDGEDVAILRVEGDAHQSVVGFLADGGRENSVQREGRDDRQFLARAHQAPPFVGGT